MRERKEKQSKNRLSRREVLREVYGRSMGGLWEVLREVFLTFQFYKSLILSCLRKMTGGLGRKKKNALKIEIRLILKIGKSQTPM